MAISIQSPRKQQGKNDQSVGLKSTQIWWLVGVATLLATHMLYETESNPRLLWPRVNQISFSAVETNNVSSTIKERKARLGDGCYHVYLDVGANIGVHGRFLFEPEKYRQSRNSVNLFRKKYGFNRTNEDYCVFEVEANPKHWPRLENVSKAYEAVGWRYHVVKAAASDKDGTMLFYRQNDDNKNEWGFSVTDWSGLNISVEVPTISLAEWIQYEIIERYVPETPPSGRKYEKPIIGMKMDIEGSEYIVLPDIMLSGVFCQLDFVFGETHPFFAPMNFTAHKISLDSRSAAEDYQDALFTVMKSSRNCHAQFLYIDDESYLHDGQPLPTPKLSAADAN